MASEVPFFEIHLTTAAKRDLAETVDFLATRSIDLAEKWYDDLLAVIETLGELPSRHTLIAVTDVLKQPMRAIIYRSHRVVYLVDNAHQIVSIVRIYHTSRAPLNIEDLS